MIYKGWEIWQDRSRQHNSWRAEWYGVTMCADTENALKSMIDQRLPFWKEPVE